MSISELLNLRIAMAHHHVSPLPSATPGIAADLACAACGLWYQNPVHRIENIKRQAKQNTSRIAIIVPNRRT